MLNLLRSPTLIMLATTAIAAGGWVWAHSAAEQAGQRAADLQAAIDAERHYAAQQSAAAEAKDQANLSALAALGAELQAANADGRQLQARLADLAAISATRAQTITRLKRENDELRAWADRPLPAAVVGLLQRPASTGAAHYQAQLPDPAAMPPAAGIASH